MTLATEDRNLTPAQQEELGKRYGDVALELLQRALESGVTDAGGLKSDLEFAPLKTRDDFQKLLREPDRRGN